tara:strand:- start:939 stop:1145 length:207 start_codon:yes stop_codon:yes gene_type:complete
MLTKLLSDKVMIEAELQRLVNTDGLPVNVVTEDIKNALTRLIEIDPLIAKWRELHEQSQTALEERKDG